MNKIYNSNELLDEVEKQDFYIFGTGFVAERFFETIRRRNLDTNIKAFITSHPSTNSYKGKSVKGIDELKEVEKDRLICIAVHEATVEEIINELTKKGYKKITWVYPLIFELWYGEPIRKNILVFTNEIIKTCIYDYRIVIRLLVIEEYYKKNNIGYNLYRKLQEVHSSKYTAEKRLEAFIRLIDSWHNIGYKQGSVLKIDENYEIFDGVHRLALAYYHKLPEIRCDIYSTKGKETYINDEIKLTEDVIEKIDFSEAERNALDACFSQLQREIS